MVATSDNFGKLNSNIKSLVDTMKSGFHKMGGAIISSISEEMQETSDTLKTGFGMMKQGGLATMEFFKNSFMLDGLRFRWQKKNFKLLEQQVALAKQERKARLSKFKGGKPKGGLLETLLMWFGLPLMLLTKGRKALKAILTFFKTLIPIRKILDGLKLSKISALFTRLKGFIAGITKSLPGAKTLLRISSGLGKLMLWFGAVLSLLDFIEGYRKTSGDTIEKIKGGLKSAMQGLLDLPVWLLTKATNWTLEQFGIKTDIGPKFKKIIDKSIDVGIALLHAILAPWQGGIDSIMSEIGITKKGDVNKWLEAWKKKISSLPEMLLKWFKSLPGARAISWAYKFLTGKDKESDVSESGGQLVRQKIIDNRFDDIETSNQKFFQDNWSKVNKNVELQQGIYQEMKINNQYQKKIFEKETESGGFVYSPPQQQNILPIPDRSENRLIENMTSSEIGYTF